MFPLDLIARGSFLSCNSNWERNFKRFRRTYPTQPKPALDRPFWRFQVDLKGAQFRHLKRAEDQGAEVYYVAPKFSDWSDYQNAYFANDILNRSLLAPPSEIFRKARGAQAHPHRVVYDQTNLHLCSDPVEMEQVRWGEVVERIARKVRGPDAESLLAQTERLWNFRSLEELRSAVVQLKNLGSPTAPSDPNVLDSQLQLLARRHNLRLLDTQVLCITGSERD